ncbi:MAG: hypothetical protein DRO05_03265 [Thermoproteota archaeon]|nr:MAG: hypothetical protein DRO05_03265 [Candidatus Korarchaeota archaeon]
MNEGEFRPDPERLEFFLRQVVKPLGPGLMSFMLSRVKKEFKDMNWIQVFLEEPAKFYEMLSIALGGQRRADLLIKMVSAYLLTEFRVYFDADELIAALKSGSREYVKKFFSEVLKAMGEIRIIRV